MLLGCPAPSAASAPQAVRPSEISSSRLAASAQRTVLLADTFSRASPQGLQLL